MSTSGLQVTIAPVLVSHDKGEQVYDVVLSARDIHRLFVTGQIRIDDDLQRGRNSTTGKQVYKEEKVARWTEQLLRDEHVFGQLTWNFRPEEATATYDAERGELVISGTATLPDSAHRHRAIARAVESVAKGSSFDLDMPFSVRIWAVPAEAEAAIFYGMNQEGDKADATRSKYLIQRNPGQKIARELVRRSRHLTEANVETVSNTLSTRNPRLTAFNTLAVACEQTFGDVGEDEVEDVVEYLVAFWDALVAVRPELDLQPLPKRQQTRKTLLSGAALAIHGYIGLARHMRDEGLDLQLLQALAPDSESDFLALAQPEWQDRGIVVRDTNKAGERTLSVRNAIQTRRAMAEALVARVDAAAATTQMAA